MITWPVAVCFVAMCGMIAYVGKRDAGAAFMIALVATIGGCTVLGH